MSGIPKQLGKIIGSESWPLGLSRWKSLVKLTRSVSMEQSMQKSSITTWPMVNTQKTYIIRNSSETSWHKYVIFFIYEYIINFLYRFLPAWVKLHASFCWDCRNKIPQASWWNNRNLFLMILKEEKFCFLLRPLFLACRDLPSYCVLTWPFFYAWMFLVPLFLYWYYWNRTPLLWPCLTLIASLKAQSPNTVTLLWLQHMTVERAQF